jgi:hypothetical protein
MNTQEKLLAEMKALAFQIQTIQVKRKAIGSGLETEYHSPNELNKLKREFADIQRKHKRLWLKSFEKNNGQSNL